ncbi:MAG TPA: protein kinase [Pirellulales bacterium]|nr:protein kinase [Pirellulales bacterium]
MSEPAHVAPAALAGGSGHDFRSAQPTWMGNLDAAALNAPMRGLLDGPPKDFDETTRTLMSSVPEGVDFGPASPPWPGESADSLASQPVPSERTAGGPLQTITSIPNESFGDGTRDDVSRLRTIDSSLRGASADAILQLWAGADAATANPRNTIRPPEGLAGSPRDSRLIITSRTVRQTQSPLRASADYELLETIGEGGVGVVYAARQASIDRTVAVKMLKPASAQKPEQRDKFLSEAVVTGDLDHPNIVPIYDLGTNESGALFYSMKRVQGTPWVAVMTKRPLTENLEILLKVADAVGFAHSRGVIHRDLKPENVMLGEYGEVLVMDWGLALVTPEFRKSRTITPSSSMGGTPAYMAPEMATGPVARVTRAADVYLLGAILFEIITGQPPHNGKTVAACLVAAARNQIDSAEHTGELLDIALKAMSTQPEDRYPSARDFQNAVRQYQAHSESITLSTRAERDLTQARRSGDYELFARALFGFQEAFNLWGHNPRAKTGISEARLAYAQSAADKGDYDLATSLLDAGDEVHGELLEMVVAAQHERALRQERLKRFKRIAVGLAAAMLIVVTGALIWVSHLYGVAEHEAQVANEEKVRADIARGKADKATVRAVRNYKDAQIQRANAERAKAEEEYAGYIAKIGLAAVKVEENAFGEVDDLLDLCPSRLRNWEWGRLKFLCGRALASFAAGAPLEAVAFDRDGRRFVTGGADGIVRLWSADDQHEPLQTFRYGDRPVLAVAISPDGRQIAAGGGDSDGFVKTWNIDSGKSICVFQGHTDAVTSVVYSADGTRLLTASCDATARLWDTAAGALQRTFRGHTWWVWSAAFSPAEDAIVTAGQDRKCILWPLDRSDQIDSGALLIFSGHAGPVYSAVFSPNGQSIVSAGYDGRVLVWNRDQAKEFAFAALANGIKTLRPEFRSLEGHTAAVRSLCVIGQGRPRIVSASHDNTVRIWDLESGALIQSLRGHAGWVRGCDVTDDGRLAVSASHDRQAKLWRLDGYEEFRVLNARVLSGHSDAITSATFSANGDRILTSSRDHTARIWSLESGRVLQSFAEGHDYLASHAIVFSDGRRFLTSGIDNTVRIWDFATGTETRTITGTGASGLVALSPDERFILTASGNTGLLWDVISGELVHRFSGHHAEVSAIAFSPDNRSAFTADVNGRMQLWNRASGENMWSQRSHSAGINAAVFTPDGNRLLTASSDHTVGQFEIATGKDLIRETLKHNDAVTQLAISSDGNRVVTGTSDGKIRIWNLNQRRVEHELAGLAGLVSNLSLSSDGLRLVTVAPLRVTGDGEHAGEQLSEIQYWDLQTASELVEARRQARRVWSAVFTPTPGHILFVGGDRAALCAIEGDEPIMTFSPHGAVTSAHYSPDETHVVTSGGDASAKVWDVMRGAALFKFALAHQGVINSAVYSPDGRSILTSSDDGTARLWNAADGALLRTFAGDSSGAQTNPVRSAAFSFDGRFVVTGSNDKTVRIFRASGEFLRKFEGHRAAVTCVTFSRDGKRIVSASEDNTARVYDAATGALVGELAGHTAAVTSVCFSPDGLRILTGSQDSTAKLWDAQTSKEILTLKGHTEDVTSVAFSSDGRYTLTGSRDGTAIVWLAEEWRNQ